MYDFQCCAVIVACCVLHNIRKKLGYDEDEVDDEFDEEPQEQHQHQNEDGFARRNNLIANYF